VELIAASIKNHFLHACCQGLRGQQFTDQPGNSRLALHLSLLSYFPGKRGSRSQGLALFVVDNLSVDMAGALEYAEARPVRTANNALPYPAMPALPAFPLCLVAHLVKPSYT
jgi:hypothetical protein